MENAVCDPGDVCAYSGGVKVCLPACDLLAQDCPDGELCLPNNEGGICVLDTSREPGAPGDSCEYANVCGPGLVCLGAEFVEDCDVDPQAGCCAPLCDVTAENTCAGAMEVCISWWEEGMAPEGYENVGVCGIPQ